MPKHPVRSFVRAAAVFAVAASVISAVNQQVFQRRLAGSLNCQIDACITSLGLGDAGSYMKMGRALASGQGIPLDLEWAYRGWPPGMAALYATLISIGRPQLSVPLMMVCLVAACWIIVLVVPVLKSRDYRRLGLATVICCAIPHSYFVLNWPLGYGILYSDGLFVVALLLCAVLLLTPSLRKLSHHNLGYALALGFGLAAMAYLRAVGELIVDLATVASLLLLGTAAASSWIRLHRKGRGEGDRGEKVRKKGYRNTLKYILVSSLVAQALMLPWRLELATHLGGQLQFTYSADVWTPAWTPSDVIPADTQWTVAAGRNYMCVAYPKECERIRATEETSPNAYTGSGAHSTSELRVAAIDAIKADPLPWAANRFKFATRAYFLAPPYSPASLLEGAIALLALMFTIVLGVKEIRRRGDIRIIFFSVCVLVATLLPPTLSHYEARYLLPVQLLGFTGLLVWVKSRTER
jgi:hypothetical protein